MERKPAVVPSDSTGVPLGGQRHLFTVALAVNGDLVNRIGSERDL